MMKMILSEYRKLFKRPISWLLLVVIVIMTLYQCHGIYHRTILKQYGNPREIVQEVDGIAYFRQADQVLHQYRGPASQEMYARIKADYHDMLDMYYLNAKPLNDDEIPYYDTDALLAVYTGIYQNQPNIHFNLDVISADDGGKSDEEALEWYGWLLDRDAAFNEVYHLKGYPEIKAQLASVYEAREIIFDSTIPNNLVLDAFDQMNFFYLLILSFLLANLFSQEKTTHMDALINSSPRGYRQTAAAKCWCAIGLAVIVFALHALTVLLYSAWMLPVRDWSLWVMNMGGAYYTLEPYQGLYTYRTLMIYLSMNMLVCLISMAMLTAFLSYLTNHQLLTYGLMVVWTVLPIFMTHELSRLFQVRMLEGLKYLQIQNDQLSVFNGEILYHIHIYWLMWIVLTIGMGLLIHWHFQRYRIA